MVVLVAVDAAPPWLLVLEDDDPQPASTSTATSASRGRRRVRMPQACYVVSTLLPDGESAYQLAPKPWTGCGVPSTGGQTFAHAAVQVDCDPLSPSNR